MQPGDLYPFGNLDFAAGHRVSVTELPTAGLSDIESTLHGIASAGISSLGDSLLPIESQIGAITDHVHKDAHGSIGEIESEIDTIQKEIADSTMRDLLPQLQEMLAYLESLLVLAQSPPAEPVPPGGETMPTIGGPGIIVPPPVMSVPEFPVSPIVGLAPQPIGHMPVLLGGGGPGSLPPPSSHLPLPSPPAGSLPPMPPAGGTGALPPLPGMPPGGSVPPLPGGPGQPPALPPIRPPGSPGVPPVRPQPGPPMEGRPALPTPTGIDRPRPPVHHPPQNPPAMPLPGIPGGAVGGLPSPGGLPSTTDVGVVVGGPVSSPPGSETPLPPSGPHESCGCQPAPINISIDVHGSTASATASAGGTPAPVTVSPSSPIQNTTNNISNVTINQAPGVETPEQGEYVASIGDLRNLGRGANLCGDAIWQELEAGEFDWWIQRLKEWEIYLTKVGRCVLEIWKGYPETWHVHTGYVAQALASLVGDEDGWNEWREQLLSMIGGGQSKSIQEMWNKGCVVYAITPGTDPAALLALKHLMVFFAELEVGSSWKRRDDAGAGLGIGGEVKIVSGELKHGLHKIKDFDAKQSIKERLCPYIAAIDWFLERGRAVTRLTPGEIVPLALNEQISEKDAAYLLSLHGIPEDAGSRLLNSEREMPTVEEFIEYNRRYGVDDSKIAEGLRKYGYLKDSEARQKVEMFDELPNISDFLIFLRRNVFDETYIETFKLTEGFEERFWAKFGQQMRSQGVLKETARLHYAAHWIVPPPGQLATALQRLRPGRVPEKVQVSEDQYLLALAEQDVAPFWRERFKELAYRTLGLRFLRQLYATSVIDDNELRRRYQDIGYKEDDARIIVASERVAKARLRAANGHGYSVANLRRLLVEGRIDTALVVREMTHQGYTGEEIDQFVKVCNADIEQQLIQMKIRTIQLRYRSGSIDLLTVRVELSRLGISPRRVDALTELTEARGQKKRVMPAVKQLIEQEKMGLLSEDEFHDALADSGLSAEQRERVWERLLRREHDEESSREERGELAAFRDSVQSLEMSARSLSGTIRAADRAEATERQRQARIKREKRWAMRHQAEADEGPA